MQMRQRDVAALDAKYTKELADAKAESALRGDVAAGRRLHIKQSVSQCVTPFGVDNAKPAGRTWFRAKTGIISPSERLITIKTTGRNPEVY